MTTARTKLWAAGTAAVALAAPLGCTALLGAGYTEAAADGGASSGGEDVFAPSDAGAEGQAAPPGADACATPPTDKSGLEANRCQGQICMPGDNAAALASGHCANDGGAIVCTVPAYAPAPTDTGAPDAGGERDGDPDGDADVDSSAPEPPTLPRCQEIAGHGGLIPSNGAFTYPSQVVYAIGSTAIQPYVGSIAQQYAAGLSDGDAGPFSATVIYVGTGSCVGVEAAYAPPAASRRTMVAAMDHGGVAKVASGAEAVYAGTYYDPTPPAPGRFPVSYSCSIDPGDPSDAALLADVGFSDVFPSSCTTLPYPAPIDPLPNAAFADLFGPVQVMEMVVPTSSKARSITYEEAQLVWGYGGEARIAPWTDSRFLFRRTAGSGTQTMIGAAIGLDPRVWKGVAGSGSGDVLSALEAVIATGLPDGGPGDRATGIDEAMGILGSDFVDDHAAILRPLAFQDRGQSCAWLPDSSAGSFDKRNVRDGHYPIWGPSHVIAPVQGGVPSHPVVNRLYAALNGQDPALSRELDVIELYATHHVVPTCAMHVTRASDGQGYSPYQPAGRTACSCYYDSVVPQDKPDEACVPCTTDADCPDATRGCNVFSGSAGFCEVKGGL